MMKLWLASYPRSGNTYFRIILDKVYSTESTAYNRSHKILPKIYRFKAPVIKTHLLPNEIFPKPERFPIVYLVRDGRDALISIAHQTMFLEESKSNYYENLREVILAANGSYFGGWSTHVNEWFKRADIVILYEDLIMDPIKTVEKIRPFMELPPPDEKQLPTFDELKYNENKRITKSVEIGRLGTKNFFRRGISGAWKDEMPEDLHEIFWKRHGAAMIKLGYTEGIIE